MKRTRETRKQVKVYVVQFTNTGHENGADPFDATTVTLFSDSYVAERYHTDCKEERLHTYLSESPNPRHARYITADGELTDKGHGRYDKLMREVEHSPRVGFRSWCCGMHVDDEVDDSEVDISM